jgi:hypothetical protein
VVARIEISGLGLAAYVKMKGSQFLGFHDAKFIFESDKSPSEWQVEYMNSEAFKHDSELMSLRKLMGTVKR